MIDDENKQRGPRKQYVQRSLRQILSFWPLLSKFSLSRTPVSFLEIGDIVGVKTAENFRSNGYAAPQANAICQSMIRYGIAEKAKDQNGKPALIFRKRSCPSGHEILDILDSLPEYNLLAERFGWINPPSESLIATNLEAAEGFSSTAAKQLARVFLEDARMVSILWGELDIEPNWRWTSCKRRDEPFSSEKSRNKSTFKPQPSFDGLVVLASLAIGPLAERKTCEIFSSLPADNLTSADLRLISSQIQKLAEEMEVTSKSFKA